MKRVRGLGGVFFTCADPGAMQDWYQLQLGIDADQHGATFEWKDAGNPEKECSAGWGPFEEGTTYFQPSTKPFMFNYRVENLAVLPETLKAEGVTVVGTIEEYPYGRFGWIMGPEGDKTGLWEPVDDHLCDDRKP